MYKLSDKKYKFPFFIVRIQHLSSNIPSRVFYGLFYSELLRIARCTLFFLTLRHFALIVQSLGCTVFYCKYFIKLLIVVDSVNVKLIRCKFHFQLYSRLYRNNKKSRLWDHIVCFRINCNMIFEEQHLKWGHSTVSGKTYFW